LFHISDVSWKQIQMTKSTLLLLKLQNIMNDFFKEANFFVAVVL
jgi:hypothetical protein